jgi:pimeloyl-ACP methyl ester carboxylesterase
MKKRLGIFLGIGGDQRALERLLPEGWELVSFSWPEPLPSDSLSSYCERSEALEMLSCDALLGFSFGSLIAMELQQAKKNIPVLIISGAIHKDEIPWWWNNAFNRIALRIIPSQFIQKSLLFLLRYSNKQGRILSRQIGAIPAQRYHWALKESLSVRFEQSSGVYRLHGRKDRLFPYQKLIGEAEIIDAGHFMFREKPFLIRDWLHKTLNSALK